MSIVAECFGRNLKRARNRVGISQEELAYLAGLHRTAVGQIERAERSPRVDTAVKLARVLDVSLDSLAAGIIWRPSTLLEGEFGVAGDADDE